ncbi:MAG: HAMP domain-containing histidine kinase [Prevotellaceae bacterium]|jgi:signal transduction histidine kinase|nr:HAMP domain-containing histidine kinase [Prevotellaceae bacterium]
MNLKYRHQIFLCFFAAFACFTVAVALFQIRWERSIRIDDLKSNLDNYARICENYLNRRDLQHDKYPDGMNALTELMPENMRITVIDTQGMVLFDNKYAHPEALENHLQRREILEASTKGSGSSIRISGSTGLDYFYFARRFEKRFIRIALPYDIEVRNLLRADNMLIYFTITFFVVLLVFSTYISRRLGRSITSLRNFAISMGSDAIRFPNTEFGEIANQIISNYRQIEQTKNQLSIEKEKLVQCFQNSDEGIGIFAQSMEPVFVNTHFVTCINVILDGHKAITSSIFNTNEFALITNFVQGTLSSDNRLYAGKLAKNGRFVSVKCAVFADRSFEIILNDVTSSETTRLLKQEMTNNIAHELRTPVSSIRGYLETMLEQQNLDEQRQRSFLERSYKQTLKLSELIRDIALITKIEEAPQLFASESINLADLLGELAEEFESQLNSNRINLEIKVPDEARINGNRTLIYSIFRNLIENSVAYAGREIEISIEKYDESPDFYFFTYSDTGKGVADKHLAKMFDRFYRIDEGRTRDSGGSGLGLAIVKNAVLFHHGEIVAKNRKEGGLEFLFTLKKK